jgi:hypothetical protein
VRFATPPFHFENDSYLDTSHGRTAAEAVANGTRVFNFAMTPGDNARLRAGVDELLHADSESAMRIAEATVNSIRTGRGTLSIVKARVTPVSEIHTFGTIESLDFRVELCVPR